MSEHPNSGSTTRHRWTTASIRKLVQDKFKKRACIFQIKVAQALYEGKDVVACAPTGAGKTLSFWIPLLMAIEDGRKDVMTFVVTPLNVLGKQNEAELAAAGIKAVAVSQENATEATFKNIENGKYNVVVINPELLMGHGTVAQWWKKAEFTKKLWNIIFDEGHCISQWGSFRKEYSRVGDLRFLIPRPERIPFYVASATLPPPVLRDVKGILRFRKDDTVELLRSNDRPDIHLMVRPFEHPASSFEDLVFLIPDEVRSGEKQPKKFLVFFDNTKEAEAATLWLRNRLPSQELKKRIKWFHSTMTQGYREDKVKDLNGGAVVGFCCTDAFGMGMDVSDIELVVQYKATCDLCTLWQRFGRAARGAGKEATAILLVEKKNTDEDRQARASRVSKKTARAGGKRKAGKNLASSSVRDILCTQDPNTTENRKNSPSSSHFNGVQDSAIDWVSEYRHQYHTSNAGSAAQSSSSKGRGKESRTVVEGSPLDHFINPPTDPGCKKCRRFWVMLYMDSDRRLGRAFTSPLYCRFSRVLLTTSSSAPNEHIECDSSFADGCPRCRPREPTSCCDLCDPEYFAEFMPKPRQSTSRNAGKSNLKAFEPTAADDELKIAIYVWRKEEATKRFKPHVLSTFGSKLLMPGDVIDRLVKCFHWKKDLETLADIQRETGWTNEADWLAVHGPSLLLLIARHRSMLEEQQGKNTAGGEEPPRKRSRAIPKCGACGSEGHNRQTCLSVKSQKAYPPPRASGLENIPPPATPRNTIALSTFSNGTFAVYMGSSKLSEP